MLIGFGYGIPEKGKGERFGIKFCELLGAAK